MYSSRCEIRDICPWWLLLVDFGLLKDVANGLIAGMSLFSCFCYGFALEIGCYDETTFTWRDTPDRSG